MTPYVPWSFDEAVDYVHELEHEIECTLAHNGMLIRLRSLQQYTFETMLPARVRKLDREVKTALDLVCIVMNYRPD